MRILEFHLAVTCLKWAKSWIPSSQSRSEKLFFLHCIAKSVSVRLTLVTPRQKARSSSTAKCDATSLSAYRLSHPLLRIRFLVFCNGTLHKVFASNVCVWSYFIVIDLQTANITLLILFRRYYQRFTNRTAKYRTTEKMRSCGVRTNHSHTNTHTGAAQCWSLIDNVASRYLGQRLPTRLLLNSSVGSSRPIHSSFVTTNWHLREIHSARSILNTFYPSVYCKPDFQLPPVLKCYLRNLTVLIWGPRLTLILLFRFTING